MQAIILAAGMGKRLKELTHDNTKCMVKVNGVAIIDRMLHQLDSRNFSRIVIVTGYKGKKLCNFVEKLGIKTPVIYVDNPIYDRTNNIYSLHLAREYLLKEDTLLFESDIIFEDAVLDCLIDDPRTSLALVDRYEPWMDGTCIRLDEDDNIVDFISGRKFDFNNTDGLYKTVNIYKISRDFAETYYVPFLEAYQKALGENEYYEQVLRVVAMLDDAEIKGKRLNNLKWYEIDDAQDLDIAETLFCEEDDKKILKIEERYGGYWRFPQLLDFCYLVNPYYPPQKMKDEMRASFDRLLIEYPSGMKVNSLLAARNFGVKPDNIVIGNGAAEIIKSLLDNTKGMVGFIKPTFEEYPNRYDNETSVYYIVKNRDYKYNAKDIEHYFGDKDIQMLIIINPDNPSGNYIAKDELISLIEWCGNKKVKIVIDESFSDFADEIDNTFIKQDILDRYSHLYVIKSISKSYGIPGLRLGMMASGDVSVVNCIKKDVSIWNVNSFAEFYMQIAEKYKEYYIRGLEEFRKERARIYGELQKIEEIRVIPSQANFFMIELLDGKVIEITKRLLVDHNILVKDLSDKIKDRELMRIAIRSREDNDKLIHAIKNVLNQG